MAKRIIKRETLQFTKKFANPADVAKLLEEMGYEIEKAAVEVVARPGDVVDWEKDKYLVLSRTEFEKDFQRTYGHAIRGDFYKRKNALTGFRLTNNNGMLEQYKPGWFDLKSSTVTLNGRRVTRQED